MDGVLNATGTQDTCAGHLFVGGWHSDRGGKFPSSVAVYFLVVDPFRTHLRWALGSLLALLSPPSYLPDIMNMLATLDEFGSKDPTSLVWPPTLPIELALKTAEPADLRVEYGYTVEEWDALRVNRVFLKELAGACELVRQEGMSFKLKAKLIAEENLKEVFRLTRDPTCPPQVRGKLIELTARWAGFDPRTNGEDAANGGGPLQANTLNIQINLGEGY